MIERQRDTEGGREREREKESDSNHENILHCGQKAVCPMGRGFVKVKQ